MANNQCDGCVYWRQLHFGGKERVTTWCCHYCLDNDKLRKRDGDVCLSRKEAPPKEKKGK